MSDNNNLPTKQAEDNADIQVVQRPYVRLEAGKHSPVNVDLANSFWEETKLKHDAVLNMLNRRALKDDIKHSKYIGHYVDLDSLIAAIPEPTPGDYADVDAGEGHPVVRYIWDETDQKWEAQVGVSTQLTGEQIKEMYEGEANTNAFTDKDKEKLDDLGGFGGTFESYEDLVDNVDYTKLGEGSYAIVEPGVDEDAIEYIWSATNQKWVRNTLDGKAIKEMYEAEGNVNTFTDTEKEKLDNLGSFGGTFESYEDLVDGADQTKLGEGSYAIVDPGEGEDVIQYIWDFTDQKWVRNTVNYGTTAGTAAQGNDPRITGAAQRAANLSDLEDAGDARQNLGLGNAATRNITTSTADPTGGNNLDLWLKV